MVQEKKENVCVSETESECGKMTVTGNLSEGYMAVPCTSLSAFLKVS